ncbi:MAG TPA: glycosyltransferase [Acidimicrobiales bacterium]|nr:glycosyltransferase [Acidimicrobiales bacterium]
MSAPDVCLIAPYPPIGQAHHDGTSGVASYSANLARALRDDGADVHVVAPVGDADRRPRDEDDDGIRVRRCFRRRPGGLRRAAAEALRSGAPVAHLQFELFLYGGPGAVAGVVPALAALRRGRTKAVVTMHQAVDPGAVDRAYTRLHRVPAPAPVARAGIAGVQLAIAGAASAVVVHEEPFADIVPGAVVVPHGIEPLPPTDRAEARRRLGLDDRFVALCFGFVAPYKGIETALEAARLAGPDVHCVVAGGEHPRLAAAQDHYADGLRAAHPEARFTGWVPGDDVAPWFRAADVALFPYPRPFSSSGALALALAAGTPSLLSAPLGRCVGAPSQLVAPTAEHLAARLRELASSPGALEQVAAATAALAEGRAWDAVARAHLDLYRGLQP